MKYSDNTKRLCVAALKFKLNKCEKRNIDFPKIKKKAKLVNPHKAYSKEELQELFDCVKGNEEIELKIHLLYDMAARV